MAIGAQLGRLISDRFGARKQAHAATLIGISQAYMSDIINGKRGISAETAVRISRVLGPGVGESLFLHQAESELEQAKKTSRA